MTSLLSAGCLGLLTCSLIRRHGWEYVPLVILMGVGRWYAADVAVGPILDTLAVVLTAGVWVISLKTRGETLTPSHRHRTPPASLNPGVRP